jgi:prolyl 4-hydroxylase
VSESISLSGRAEAMAEGGRAAEAVDLLRAEARRGSAEAWFTLAAWRLAGRHLPRDLPLSRNLFGQAADAGHPAAAAVYTAFLANGTGGPREWARALTILERRSATEPSAADQLALLRAMELEDDGDPARTPAGETLSDSPSVTFVRALFSNAECDYLARAAEPLLAPGKVVHPVSGAFIDDPVRRSDVAAFPLAREDPAIHALNRRLAAASGTRPEQGEPLQILRYRPGQEYRPHNDALPTEENKRILTALVWLNEGYDGGETHFPETGLSVRGRKGDALLFRNTLADLSPDPASRHAGLPVTRGEKLIASRWIRARPLDLSQPAAPR